MSSYEYLPPGWQERIRTTREARGLSQREVAGRAGLSHAALSKLETGQRPRAEAWALLKIARVLGVSLDWLLSGEGPEPSFDQAAVIASFPPALRQAIESRKVTAFTLTRLRFHIEDGGRFGRPGWSALIDALEIEARRTLASSPSIEGRTLSDTTAGKSVSSITPSVGGKRDG